MATKEFLVLYTHQKRKKAKVWQDGVLRVSEQGTRAALYGEGDKRLDQLHIKQTQACVGEELESEKYLITIEEVKPCAGNTAPVCPPADGENGDQSRVEMKPSHLPTSHLHAPASQASQEPTPHLSSQPPSHAFRRQPLKRRRAGFVPPRQLEKKPSLHTEDATSSSTSVRGPVQAPSFGSPRQASSLFSTPWSNADSPKSQTTGIIGLYGNTSRNSDQADDITGVGQLHPPEKFSELEQFQSVKEGTLCSVQESSLENSTMATSRTSSDVYFIENYVRASPSTEAPTQTRTVSLDGGGGNTAIADSSSETSTLPSHPSAGGSKRSTSQILALLGKGKRGFQPPLKQNQTKLLHQPPSESSTLSNAGKSFEATPFPHEEENSCIQNRTLSDPRTIPDGSTHVLGVYSEPGNLTEESTETVGDAPLLLSVEPAVDRVSDGEEAGRGENLNKIAAVLPCDGEEVETNSQITGSARPTTGFRRGFEKRQPLQPVHRDNQPHRPLQVPRQTGTKTHLQGMESSRPPLRQKDGAPVRGFRAPVLKELNGSLNVHAGMAGELSFPAAECVQSGVVPLRKVAIPVFFSSVPAYKQVLMAAVKEHLSILLYELSSRYHSALAKADISSYGARGRATHGGSPGDGSEGSPPCRHGQPAKMACVKKEGPNKGRMFYVCSNARESQCKFFMWADQYHPEPKQTQTSESPSAQVSPHQVRPRIPLHGADAIEGYVRARGIHLYCEGGLSRRGSLNEGAPLSGAPSWVKKYRAQQINSTAKKLYLKIQRKEHSSTYAKDDLWVISKDLTFDPASSFVAKSVFHGPSSSSEIEIEPLAGYSPSNWPSDGMVHGLLACNASTELTCLDNIQEYLNPRTLPILPHLINSDPISSQCERNPPIHRRTSSVTPSITSHINVAPADVAEIVEETINMYHLNADQATALHQVAGMFLRGSGDPETRPPLTLIHGVFGAGKSYLLAVTVLLLVRLFSLSERTGETGREGVAWKILIASTTNVAVDRILLGLLDLGFEEFIRVGSLRKIAKPILPYSVHASDRENQEVRELQEMLRGELSAAERQHVRRSLERQRLGKNKGLLATVRVVGVTCAACSFPCIRNLAFPVVLLDECSQMTEPSSLLPVARFGCEKLVLVGDPHQLDPTIQGSEPSHKSGLEQTLFDRLTLMGYDPIVLRTQYRCHPSISGLANSLFYQDQLLDGVIEEDRPPLIRDLPTLCFFNVPHGREACAGDGSYHNDAEAGFVVSLIGALVRLGVAAAELGVITLYRAQVSKIHTMLQLTGDKTSELKAVQISTVDAFQGGEKSVIILSCVRTQHVGFIDSDKRTNVALTRARNHLLMVGGMRMLCENPLWGEVIHKCQERPDGVKDCRAFQKLLEERLAEMDQPGDGGKDRRSQAGGRRKKRKIERQKGAGVTSAMPLDNEDDDFVLTNTSAQSPVPFDACTPVTPISPSNQMEQSAALSEHISPGTFHFPSEGDPAATATQDEECDSSVSPIDQSTHACPVREGHSILSKGCTGSTPQENTEERIDTSFSYSPLEEVVESDSGDSEEDLPNFDIGNLL